MIPLHFHCSNPDFVVRSIPDNVEYGVRKARLAECSEVFKDMFTFGPSEESSTQPECQKLEVSEAAAELSALLFFIHSPPPPPEMIAEDIAQPPNEFYQRAYLKCYDSSTAIPFPLLVVLLKLGDKYALNGELIDVLKAHLVANAGVQPLKVYGLARRYGMHDVASDASAYLLDPPMASYSLEEVEEHLPRVGDYHLLARLQAFRVKRLREVLDGEDVFPHGYGSCQSHEPRTRILWDSSKAELAVNLGAATDVAAELAVTKNQLRNCDTCIKAWSIAVDMLAYKCRKIPRKIDKILSGDLAHIPK